MDSSPIEATEAPAASPALAPITLQVQLALPAEFAEFGLVERVTLPPGLLEQLAEYPEFADMVGHALQQQFTRAAWSLATSLHAVLVQRAAADGPLTHDVYIAEQSRLLAERRDAVIPGED